ncbi:Na/Pi cotransporter family protein [Devosia crocina]|uniref:Na/Pi cotransporter family protein n=1 Tax=Devosia crocina TaxID=429728 RepID=UPI001586FDB2|nr:Na/Pi cotransporter family protein [Devosia crocina]
MSLLLFGLSLLKGGLEAALGARLRLLLANGADNRGQAFVLGLLVTMVLQSSTATAALMAGFVSAGLVSLVMAQAAMLGANVGTSLVSQILAFELDWLSPVALVLGLGLRRFGRNAAAEGTGNAAIGLALMLLSLALLKEASAPLQQAPAFQVMLVLVEDAPVVAILISAALAALAASSLAIVLFVASLAAGGLVGPELCLLLIAGANLGGALPPFLMTLGGAGRQMALANLLVRGVGAIAVASCAWLIGARLAWLDPASLAVQAHIAFNLSLAAAALPLLGPISRLVSWLAPLRASPADGPHHLNEKALAEPKAAIAAAMRESLRITDMVRQMLTATLGGLRSADEAACRSASAIDHRVDVLQEAVKLYLSRLSLDDLERQERRRVEDITAYTINLEHIGDVIQRSLVPLLLKNIRMGTRFSKEGFAEIEHLFEQILGNLNVAETLFLDGDIELARKLFSTKLDVRRIEQESRRKHLERLRSGDAGSLATSSIHLDLLRDLKRINGHIASTALPSLERAGLLNESRLK